jgi:hypothetical protein
MKALRVFLGCLVFATLLTTVGCPGGAPPKDADVSPQIREAFDKAGLKDVAVRQDKDAGAIVVSGHVATPADKAQALSIASEIGQPQIVSDQITVVPPAAASGAPSVGPAKKATPSK